jgi:predicted DNA-binding transcriptional regulator AlpA
LIRESELRKYDGLGHSRRWDLVLSGEYPPPLKLTPGGRAKAWLVREVVAYQSWRIAVRDGSAGKNSGWRDYLDNTSA